jgi:hypothetical protein
MSFEVGIDDFEEVERIIKYLIIISTEVPDADLYNAHYKRIEVGSSNFFYIIPNGSVRLSFMKISHYFLNKCLYIPQRS